MTPLFTKLNLKQQTAILILNAPDSFEAELDALEGVTIERDLEDGEDIQFCLAFVTQQEAVNQIARALAPKLQGDAVVWFAYPKGSSKKYRCDFNRDRGWAVLGELGLEGVRQVAIDTDWSALRFRRVEFIKTMSRDQKRAISTEGKAKVAGNKPS